MSETLQRAFKENDCAYISNPTTKEIVVKWDGVEYPLAPKSLTPFLSVICNQFLVQHEKLSRVELDEVVIKIAPTPTPDTSA